MSTAIGGVSSAYFPQQTQPATRQSETESGKRTGETAQLSAADERVLVQLKQRDEEVRAHEQAHIAAGGDLITSRANFTYEIGPDSKRYAIGGEVGIDTSKGSTPEETLDRAARIRNAALAPAEPSAQDRQVAAEADRMASEARQELQARNREASTDGPRNPTDLFRMVAAINGTPRAYPTLDIFA